MVDSNVSDFLVGSPYPAEDGYPLARNDQEHFLGLMDRVLDPAWLDPLKRGGSGYELLEAFGKVFERISEATIRFAEGQSFSWAKGASYATGQVTFYRANSLKGAVTVKAGTVVTSSGGRYFRTIEDARFGASDLITGSVNARAVFPGPQHNVLGPQTTPGGVLLVGEIDTLAVLLTDPPYGDPTIKVKQASDFTGGQTGDLDLLGAQRNLPRVAGEGDDAYRFRLRNLPDNITPAAVRRAVAGLLNQYGVGFEFVETYDTNFQTAYDDNDGTTFVLDDPRDLHFPTINLVPDDRELWATFYVVVRSFQPIEDWGGALDDTDGETPAGRTSPDTGGVRAITAYDLADDPEGLPTAVLDGRDVTGDALLGGVWDLLQSLKAAGITAGLMQEGRG